MWEYAPQYILGMYAYLLPMATVAKPQFLLRLCSMPCGFKPSLWLLITTITEKWCLLHGTFFSTMLKPGGMSCTMSNLSCITSRTWHGILISQKCRDFSRCQFCFQAVVLKTLQQMARTCQSKWSRPKVHQPQDLGASAHVHLACHHFLRLHKEEWFLFPIYPMSSFGTTIAMDRILSASEFLVLAFTSTNRGERGCLESNYRFIVGLIALVVLAIISILLSMTLHHHYHALLDLYQRLFTHLSQVQPPLVGMTSITCAWGANGKGSPPPFFSPPSTIRILKVVLWGSAFSTLYFLWIQGSKSWCASWSIYDVDREEMNRYLSIKDCTFVIEMVSRGLLAHSNEILECLQNMATDTTGSWSLLLLLCYLNAEFTSPLHRTLYLPFGRGNNVVYKKYNLYFKSQSVAR